MRHVGDMSMASLARQSRMIRSAFVRAMFAVCKGLFVFYTPGEQSSGRE